MFGMKPNGTQMVRSLTTVRASLKKCPFSLEFEIGLKRRLKAEKKEIFFGSDIFHFANYMFVIHLKNCIYREGWTLKWNCKWLHFLDRLSEFNFFFFCPYWDTFAVGVSWAMSLIIVPLPIWQTQKENRSFPEHHLCNLRHCRSRQGFGFFSVQSTMHFFLLNLKIPRFCFGCDISNVIFQTSFGIPGGSFNEHLSKATLLSSSSEHVEAEEGVNLHDDALFFRQFIDGIWTPCQNCHLLTRADRYKSKTVPLFFLR